MSIIGSPNKQTKYLIKNCLFVLIKSNMLYFTISFVIGRHEQTMFASYVNMYTAYLFS